jgi:hypothetical protein
MVSLLHLPCELSIIRSSSTQEKLVCTDKYKKSKILHEMKIHSLVKQL